MVKIVKLTKWYIRNMAFLTWAKQGEVGAETADPKSNRSMLRGEGKTPASGAGEEGKERGTRKEGNQQGPMGAELTGVGLGEG